ncbi:serine/threonine-protein kinase [Nocardia sp. NPDC050406]|uniref:serine/threonine-protein kinase n=1 Tax=Nocardia sp. NPDC050406 TaxID=3364318 RepID=UPI0037B568B7
MSTRHEPLAVGSRFGPYRLDRLIGRGGMGEVYEAYDTVKDRTVAIKVLPERLADDPVYRQRFQRESHAAARLREAHVIPIHDYGEIDGRLFIDMRLVDGDSLRSLLHRAGPGSPERAVGVIAQVASALDAAHAEGLLHRDIKPDNILLSRNGFAYLVDFGIAQSSTDPALTSTGTAVGSYRYMAPERFTDSPLTPAADVYGLACVLFECLTGTRPYSGRTDAEIMRAHLFDPVPKPTMVRSTVPAGFNAVIARGMAKQPRERYSSAGDLAEAAATALGGTAAAAASTAVTRTSPGAAESATESTLPGSNTWWQSSEAGRSERQPLAQGAQHSGPRPSAAEAQRSGSQPVASEANHLGVPSDSSAHNSREGSGPRLTGQPPDTGHTAGERNSVRSQHIRRAVSVLAVLALVAGSLGFAGWAWTQRESSGTATANASAPRGADIALLSMVNSVGYKRANCNHLDGDATTTALLSCSAKPSTSTPMAQFRSFASVDDLRSFYTAVLESFRSDGCAGSESGRDSGSVVDGKEVGRKACYDDLTRSPTNPSPVLVLTNEASLALAIYIWEDPTEKPLRDHAATYDRNWQFAAPGKGRDPDYFTEADRALLAHLGTSYTADTCSHYDPPPGGTANTVLDCGAPVGAPGVSFFGFPERRLATGTYQALLGQFRGRVCGGGTAADEVWRKGGVPVGRYFCYIDSSLDPDRDCLMAVNDEYMTTVGVCALPPDSPEPGPKTETELLAWFQERFGTE